MISGETQLLPRAYKDTTCSLHLLQEEIEPYDLAVAFSKSFSSDSFRDAVSRSLLDMQEDGTLTVRPLSGKSAHACAQWPGQTPASFDSLRRLRKERCARRCVL